MEQALLSIAQQAYREPREAASRLQRMEVPREALIPAFGLIAIIRSVLQVQFMTIVGWPTPFSYLGVASVAALTIGLHIPLLWKSGELLGGTANLEKTAQTDLLLHSLMIPPMAAMLIALYLGSMLGGLAILALGVWMLWIHLNVVDVLHGFGSLAKSFSTLAMAAVGAVLLGSILSSVLGLG